MILFLWKKYIFSNANRDLDDQAISIRKSIRVVKERYVKLRSKEEKCQPYWNLKCMEFSSFILWNKASYAMIFHCFYIYSTKIQIKAVPVIALLCSINPRRRRFKRGLAGNFLPMISTAIKKNICMDITLRVKVAFITMKITYIFWYSKRYVCRYNLHASTRQMITVSLWHWSGNNYSGIERH